MDSRAVREAYADWFAGGGVDAFFTGTFQRRVVRPVTASAKGANREDRILRSRDPEFVFRQFHRLVNITAKVWRLELETFAGVEPNTMGDYHLHSVDRIVEGDPLFQARKLVVPSNFVSDVLPRIESQNMRDFLRLALRKSHRFKWWTQHQWTLLTGGLGRWETPDSDEHVTNYVSKYIAKDGGVHQVYSTGKAKPKEG